MTGLFRCPLDFILYRMLGLPAVAAVALFQACATSPSRPSDSPAIRNVILISIDGLRPEFYLSPVYHAPTLQRLAKEGSAAEGVLPIYPSITYPGHATLATGVRSSIHGIFSNRVFSAERGATKAWYWSASLIRVPTLWGEVGRAGKKAALLNWPVSVGANASWVVPEVFPEDGYEMPKIWEETEKNTDPALLKELVKVNSGSTFKDINQHNWWMSRSAAYLLDRYRPDLLLLHLPLTDLMQHFTGAESQQTRKAVSEIDRMIKDLVARINLEKSCLLIVGDHGFENVTKTIRLNSLFATKGWLQTDSKGDILSWRVIAHTSGGQAAVYTKEPGLSGEVRKTLIERSKGLYRIIEREELDRLKAFPDALLAIEPKEGYAASMEAAGELISTLPAVHGEHGYLPNRPKMRTGFLAAGACANPGQKLGTIQLVDIAPTAAKVLGISLPDAEGSVLPLRFR